MSKKPSGKMTMASEDMEVILHGTLIQAVRLFQRVTGWDLRGSKDTVERFRSGTRSWREYFDLMDPCPHCQGTGFGKKT
jgi:hypothetical protein